MTLQGSPNDHHGEYKSNPENTIPSNSSTAFQLEAEFTLGFTYGSNGYCDFQIQNSSGNTGTVRFSYVCPQVGSNSAGASWQTSPVSDIVLQMIPNPLPEYGHPVHVQFIVSEST